VLGPASVLLAEQPIARDFSAQEIYTANLSFDSAAWALGPIRVTLELNQAGNWTVLDSKDVTVVDLTPPLLALTAPAEGVIAHGPLALAATASDALSGIASVEASIDDGPWNALDAGPSSTYTSAALALADGDHTVDLRAHDGAGNAATAGPGHFTIDTLPPLINIAAVAEGDLLNHAVAPTISIADPHLSSSDVHLNDQAYVSGTTIATSGTYTLAATAADAAGNSSSSSVHFTLDLDPPTVVFTSPAANATVATASIEVIGQTESGAHVHLSIGGFSVDQDADASGLFDVAGVPLTPGPDTISARATDLAGNVGPVATLSVTYQVAGLTGSLAGLAPQIARGLPLDVPYTLRNTGNVDFVALPLRIELHPASGGPAQVSDDFSGDIAGGADAPGMRELATATLQSGDYTAVLLANMPAVPGPAGWITLDTASTRVFLDPCRSNGSDVIFADDFDGNSRLSGDEIFCNGFEQLLAFAAKALGIEHAVFGSALSMTAADALPAVRAMSERHAAAFAAASSDAWVRGYSLAPNDDLRIVAQLRAPGTTAMASIAPRGTP
jgi:Bacterial Ig domain